MSPARATRAVVLAVALALAWAVPAGAGDIAPLRQGTFAQIVGARSGQSFLVVLWSVTCAPCRQEFELLAALRKAHPDLRLVLVSTDDMADREAIGQVLARHGLDGEPSWAFADADAQRLRYEIDPAWYGEMPRAYFYEADGRRQGVSGSLRREQVEAWLARGPQPPAG